MLLMYFAVALLITAGVRLLNGGCASDDADIRLVIRA